MVGATGLQSVICGLSPVASEERLFSAPGILEGKCRTRPDSPSHAEIMGLIDAIHIKRCDLEYRMEVARFVSG